MNRPLWRTIAVLVVALSGAVLVAAPSSAADPSSAAVPSIAPGVDTATFTTQSSWDAGYVGSFTITNGSDYRHAWQLEFTLPAGTAVEHYWGAQITRDADRYFAIGQHWNTTVEPGGSVTFGFIAKGTGAPSSWRVNNGPCVGSGCRLPDIKPPTTPGNLNKTEDGRKWTLRWSASSDDVGVVGYEIYLGNEAHVTLLKTVTGAEYVYELPLLASDVQVAPPPADYAFRVRAIDAVGNASPYAAVSWYGRFDDKQAPTAPVKLSFGGGADGSTLTWGKSTDDFVVAGYDVYVNDERYGPTSRTSLTVAPVGFGTFTFSVIAFDVFGKRSPAIKQALAIDPGPDSDARPPTAPTKIGASPTGSELIWTWTASTDNVGVRGYQVFRGANWIANVTSTTFSEPLARGQTYHDLRVRAFDSAGNKSAFATGWIIIEWPRESSGPTAPVVAG